MSKVVIIGLDGATWKILDPLIQENRLPYFSSIINKGCRGTSQSTIPPLTAPAWVTFQTGVNQGTHGIFDFYNYSKDSVNKELITSKDIQVPRFWETLNANGKRTIIINMPVTYPIDSFGNNVVVSSFLTPQGKKYAHPQKALSILKQIGYQIDVVFDRYGFISDRALTANRKKMLYKKLIEQTNIRKTATISLARRFKWDLIFLLFKETDLVQHLFWDNKQTSNYYIHLDRVLKSLVKELRSVSGDSLDIIFLSDHGFHKSPKWKFSIIQWLIKEKFLGNIDLVDKVNITSKIIKEIKKYGIDMDKIDTISNLKSKSRKIILNRVKDSFKRKSSISATHWGLFTKKIEQKKIKIIKNKLKSLKYNNKPIFKMVAYSKEIYKGPFKKYAPDIVFIPSKEFLIDPDPTYQGEIIIPLKMHLKGHHYSDQEGIVLGCGTNIRKTRSIKMKLEDFSPTILALLGVDIPDWMEGKVNTTLIKMRRRTKTVRKNISQKKIDIESMIKKEIENINKT